jgi:peptidoglycan/xylan/chitin deacetylase (PgdA/CDA1 family)
MLLAFVGFGLSAAGDDPAVSPGAGPGLGPPVKLEPATGVDWLLPLLPPTGARRTMRLGGRPAHFLGFVSDPGPEVRLAAPAALHAPIDAQILLQFSQAMDRGSVQRSFRIEPDVAGSFDWADERTMAFHPDAPLAYRTTYRVVVAGFPAIGRRLVAAGSFSFSTVWPPPQVPFPFTLTFDDCGTAAQIQAILDALADRGLQAIFFPTGQCRDQYPWLISTLLAAGHRVCNHTYSHPDLSRLSAGAIRAEILRGVSVDCDLFRPPYGAMDRSGRVAGVAASLGYRVQIWDVDTRDWAGTPADVMVAMIRAKGGVVLFHMHGRNTVEAVRTL